MVFLSGEKVKAAMGKGLGFSKVHLWLSKVVQKFIGGCLKVHHKFIGGCQKCICGCEKFIGSRKS